MKVTQDDSNNATVETEGLHTHTMIFADTEKQKHIKGFEKVEVRWSDFPANYKGVHLDTFDNGTLIIGIPRTSKLLVGFDFWEGIPDEQLLRLAERIHKYMEEHKIKE